MYALYRVIYFSTIGFTMRSKVVMNIGSDTRATGFTGY